MNYLEKTGKVQKVLLVFLIVFLPRAQDAIAAVNMLLAQRRKAFSRMNSLLVVSPMIMATTEK